MDVTVENLDSGRKLKYSGLVPLMIERYGFYEGKGTSYRVEPRNVVEVFDFLKNEALSRKKKKWLWISVIVFSCIVFAVFTFLVYRRRRKRSSNRQLA